MTPGERVRASGASGVSRFLAAHQRCNAGFDVARDSGASGAGLRIACKGCGQAIAYRSAEARRLGEAEEWIGHAAPEWIDRGAAGRRDGAASRGEGLASARASKGGREAALPDWLANLLIAAMVIAGMALIVIGSLSGGS